MNIKTIPNRGQIWSSDLALSLLVFAIVSVIAYMLITNMVQDTNYSFVRLQAQELNSIIGTEGFPSHWNSTDVIKIGLQSNDVLSLRKLRELSIMDPMLRKNKLRLSDDYAIYITDSSNATSGIMGVCAIGDSSAGAIMQNKSLPATAIHGSHHELFDALNITMINQTSYAQSYSNFSAQDVIIVEGNILNISNADAASIVFDDQSKRGITFVVVGNPGASILGIDVNASNQSNISVIGNSGLQLGFSNNELLAIYGNVSSINDPTNPAVQDYAVIATTSSGKPAIAKWLYNDAQVYYIATINGTNSVGAPLVNIIANATKSLVNVSWPACNAINSSNNIVPSTATQAAEYSRTLSYHDQFLTLHSVVWRVY